jgi:AraC-like DNA-binding protein
MSFPKIMALITLLTRDRTVEHATVAALRPNHHLARVATWSKLLWWVREHPVTCVVADGAALPRRSPEVALRAFVDLYPSVPIVVVSPEAIGGRALFQLGRAGLSGLVLVPLDGMAGALPVAVQRSLARGSTDGLVTRAVSPSLPRRELEAVRLAMEAVQQGWDTDGFAGRAGLTRAHLSVLLRATGLPSAGRLLTWARMLHAGRWLCDPGRTAESVSRQLAYSNGAAFRRALRNYVGATPTELIADGGVMKVLERFVQECDLHLPPRALGSVA